MMEATLKRSLLDFREQNGLKSFEARFLQLDHGEVHACVLTYYELVNKGAQEQTDMAEHAR